MILKLTLKTKGEIFSKQSHAAVVIFPDGNLGICEQAHIFEYSI